MKNRTLARLLCRLCGHRLHHTLLREADKTVHRWKVCFRCNYTARDGVVVMRETLSGDVIWSHGP